MTPIQVGDEVRVYFNARRGSGGERGEVVKVGRKLAMIRAGGRDHEFRLDTQRSNGPQYGHGTSFRTMEQVALSERRSGAEGILRDAGVELSHRKDFTLEQIEALAEVARTFGKDAQ